MSNNRANAATERNPYLAEVAAAAAVLMRLDPQAMVAHELEELNINFQPGRGWEYPRLANTLLLVAAGADWDDPAAAAQAMDFCRKTILILVDAAPENHWWRPRTSGREGDRNIDRFTAVPLLEALLLLDGRLGPDLAAAARTRLAGVLERQLSEYGGGRLGFPDQPYPNMDAYYALLMQLAAAYTGEARWGDEAGRFLDILASVMFPDGAWTYIGGTNECPLYHGINVILLGRLQSLVGEADPRPQRMLRKSIPYYPLTVLPDGSQEFFTDPWWKHIWQKPAAGAPDMVASLTGDGHNRWLGDRLRAQTLEGFRKAVTKMDINHIIGINAVYSAWLWRDVEPLPCPDDWLLPDRNIEGPRACFPAWSWAATARYGSDTLVGAVVHRRSAAEPLTALMAVTAEVVPPQGEAADAGSARQSLAITPPGTAGRTEISGGGASFAAEYQLAAYTSVWGKKPLPQDWRCRQQWRLERNAIRGQVELISGRDQESGPPRVRIVCGRGRNFAVAGKDCWNYGPLRIRILSGDFPEVATGLTPMPPYNLERDCPQLILGCGLPAGSYAAGRIFRLELEIALGRP